VNRRSIQENEEKNGKIYEQLEREKNNGRKKLNCVVVVFTLN